MVTTVGSGELLPNSGIASNALNFLQNLEGRVTEKAGQAAGAIAETASQAKAALPGTAETVDLLQKWQSARLKLLETRSRNGLLQEV